MAPRYGSTIRYLIIFVCTFLCTPVNRLYATDPDSIRLLKKDTIAYRLFLYKPDSALQLAKETLSQASANGYTEMEGLSYYIMSKAYWAKADYSNSAEYGFKALRIFENTKQTRMWGKCLLAVARTFIDLQNLSQGRKYIDKALNLGRSKNDELLVAEAYRERSMLLSETRQYDSALYYADLGITLFEKYNDSLDVSILYGRKAKIYFLLKDYKKSESYNRKSMLYDSLVGNRRALGITYYQAALDKVHLGKLDSAITLLKKSIAISKEIRNVSGLIKAHTLMSNIYLEKNKTLDAVAELKTASLYKDTLYSTEKSGQIQEMESLYELSSKEKTIKQLAEDNLLQQQVVINQRFFVAFLLIGVLSLGLTVYFLSRLRALQSKTNAQLESKNTAIEQQKEEILAQAETLQQLNDLKSKLFSVISHDLRGPMATLRALLDLLTRQRVTQEEFVSISEKVKNSLGVTERTLENLLNWSLSQMEGIRAEPKVIDVKNTIAETCSLMQETAQRKLINLENKISNEVLVSADSDQLQLILRNLIHNAIKFSKPSDTIIVTAERNVPFCVISVKDNGIGMTHDELHTLVDTKHYFSKVGTQKEKGTGLGLLLCKEFIKLNGGELNIKSNLNQGTEVTFTLPLADR
jgi:two-component system, sensor histidine kinase and response regulator